MNTKKYKKVQKNTPAEPFLGSFHKKETEKGSEKSRGVPA
jgi:hypothetical protein